jgi:hypothetical protein
MEHWKRRVAFPQHHGPFSVAVVPVQSLSFLSKKERTLPDYLKPVLNDSKAGIKDGSSDPMSSATKRGATEQRGRCRSIRGWGGHEAIEAQHEN